jgi:acetyl esterase/lipase
MHKAFLLVLLPFLGGAVAAPAAEGELKGKAGSVEEYVYKKTPQGELHIFVHFPGDWKEGDKRPAVVFFFGGGWSQGNIKQFVPQAEYLATRGMVTARADYRVRTRHNTTPDKCVEDCKSAVRWLRQHAGPLGIDPDRIAAGGGSAGGHTAAATGILTGLEAPGEDTKVSSKPNLLLLFNPVMNTTGVSQAGSAEIAKQISPNDHLTRDAPPAILFFGTDDRLLATGEEYLQLAQKQGLTAELWTAEGVGHGFFNRSPWTERTLHLADEFLARHGWLQGKPTIKAPETVVMKPAAKSPGK